MSMIPYRLMLPFFVAVALFGAATLSPSRAEAQQVSAEVRVILGTSGGGTVDAALSTLAPRLARQFAQFDSFRQHSSHRLTLVVGQAQSITLPGNQTATIELRSVTGGEQELRVSIPGGGTTLRTRGGLFFVGGASVPGGTLILAIST
ncbi:MAG: hypothetical protein H6674_11165 [Dehalococcoidia bacterium]|nr:hypothetical protein [Dehalococcoidia bacterium]